MIIIDGADRMNPNAGNALLKSLEEPRPATMFVLVADAAHRVLPTLRSRCQRLQFSPLADDLMRQIVERELSVRELEVAADAVAAACRLADGSPGSALELLSGEDMAGIGELKQALWDAARGVSAEAVFAVADGAGRDRALIARALTLLSLQLRDRLRKGPESDDAPRLVTQIRAIHDAQVELESNANIGLALSRVMFRLRGGAAAVT